jgi:S1-C subfamily serine protease
MNRSRPLVFATALLAAGSLSLPVRAASAADAAAGRTLVKRYADAIVSVELVVTLKMKVGDREMPPREQKIEVNGTVISSSGLTLTSLAEVDPQTSFDASRAAGGGGRGGAELVGVEFKEAKLRMADGKEVSARFVLKDADLDLAFMAPDVPADGAKPEFSSVVKLDEPADGALLGSYFYLSRASKALQRVPLVRTTEILGIVEKPRKFFLMTDVAVGTPQFDASGKVLGITLWNFAGGRRSQIVLPAADIAEMAKQAATAQAAPKKE